MSLKTLFEFRSLACGLRAGALGVVCRKGQARLRYESETASKGTSRLMWIRDEDRCVGLLVVCVDGACGNGMFDGVNPPQQPDLHCVRRQVSCMPAVAFTIDCLWVQGGLGVLSEWRTIPRAAASTQFGILTCCAACVEQLDLPFPFSVSTAIGRPSRW